MGLQEVKPALRLVDREREMVDEGRSAEPELGARGQEFKKASFGEDPDVPHGLQLGVVRSRSNGAEGDPQVAYGDAASSTAGEVVDDKHSSL